MIRLSAAQGLAAIVTLAAVVTILATPDLSWRVMAISSAAITAFATRSLPEAVTALCVFLAFLAINAAPQEVIFSGLPPAGSGCWSAGSSLGRASPHRGWATK